MHHPELSAVTIHLHLGSLGMDQVLAVGAFEHERPMSVERLRGFLGVLLGDVSAARAEVVLDGIILPVVAFPGDEANQALVEILEAGLALTATSWEVAEAVASTPRPEMMLLPGQAATDPLAWVDLADPSAVEVSESWEVLMQVGILQDHGYRTDSLPSLVKMAKPAYGRLRNDARSWLAAAAARSRHDQRLGFELIVPGEPVDPWFLLPVRLQPGSLVPLGRNGRDETGLPEHLDLDMLLRMDAGIVAAPGEIPDDLLKVLVDDTHAALAATEMSAHDFLSALPDLKAVEDTVERLQQAGFACVLPDFWSRPSKPKAKGKLAGKSGDPLAESLVFTAEFDVDGVRLSPEEVERLSRLGSGLVHLGGAWRRVDERVLSRLADVASQTRQPISPAMALDVIDGDVDTEEVEGWLPRALKGDWTPGMAELLPQPEGVASTVTMRPYQLQALSWFAWLEANNLGGILADDMGLGKTLTTLSLIAHDHQGPTLVVCPTSLVRNWEREAGKFTPGLRVKVHHGPDRVESDVDADLVVTTFHLLMRSPELFASIPWHRVVVDEAQFVKNPASSTHQAVKAVPATHKHVLTGTPVGEPPR